MADELELLRRADPVPADGPRFGDGPLDHTAERRLERLLRERPAAPRRRTRLTWALAATAVVTALVSALLFTGRTAAPAVAAPRPLAVRVDTAAVPLGTMAERARTAAADATPRLRKGTHVQTWSLGMSDGRPPITLPEERVVRWHADDSRTETVVATDPTRPGRQVLTDEGGEPRPVDDGHVLSRRTYPPSWSDAPPGSPPPRDPARLHDYLEEAQRAFLADHGKPLGTAELLDATKILLDGWTLGAAESAALIRLLADADGLRPAGQLTDRLGRRGQAYVYDGPGGLRTMLILAPATGAVLGLEQTFTRDEPRYGVKAGDVMQYSAWIT